MTSNLGVIALLLAAAWVLPTAVVAQTTTPMLAGGYSHSLALLPDGTVKAWGDNFGGKLGTGSTLTYVYTPLQIPASNLSNVIAVVAGDSHSLALLSNGTVKAWGYNSFGQLGLGNTTNQNTPQQIPASNLSNVLAIASNGWHSLALLSNGTVMAWGWNQYGQLGLGNTTNQDTPRQIPASSLSNVVAIAVGLSHSLALCSNGQVMAWGSNGFGELGIGITPYPWYQTKPQAIPGSSLSNVTSIDAGSMYSLAKLSDGTVKAWGDHYYGQLGLGIIPWPGTQYTPQQIPASNLSNVTSIATGDNHSFALLSDGRVKAWGWNIADMLGLGYSPTSPTAVATPQLIPGLCLSGATGYALQFGSLGNSALGMSISCNPVTGGLSAQHYYFNTFSTNPLNATSPGTGAWQGLHTTQAEVLSWLSLGTNGFPLVLGPLDATGGAAASTTLAPSSLSGLTFYGVSVAFHPVTFAVVANSTVISYTF